MNYLGLKNGRNICKLLTSERRISCIDQKSGSHLVLIAIYNVCTYNLAGQSLEEQKRVGKWLGLV